MDVEDSTVEDRGELTAIFKDYPETQIDSWSDIKISEAIKVYELFLVNGMDKESAGAKIVELYSPPRVTERLGKLRYKGLTMGTTFDLRPNRYDDSYDFTKAEDRAKARRIIKQ